MTVPIALAAGVILTIPALGTNANEARGSFRQTNLVTDDQQLAKAKFTDTNLKNPWGISSSRTSPMWVSDNNAGVTTLYTGNGTQITSIIVTIPPGHGSAQGSPTGTVFNGNNTEFGGDRFLFATEDGTIAGWQGGSTAVTRVDNSTSTPSSVYKGLAIGFDGLADHIYASNFGVGRVDVFNSDYSPAGSFTDPKVPDGYAPFNVQNLGGVLYVTFAKQNAVKHDDIAGRGHGFVDAFDLNGHLLDRLVSRGRLDSPWGLAIAPASFGALAGTLLVGNFGDGHINAYTLDEGDFKGALRSANGSPIAIDGLWALRVGSGGGGASGDPRAVYFTAGINHENDGLFGTITNAGSGD
ncbi:MAG TPA: TIGR03118 family protein [Candidatus Dormibacteraeota bacterium]|nr:TIGR03118 family protein [Candidatus Dormibacteraeota bacterium]